MATRFTEVIAHYLEHEARYAGTEYAPETNPQLMAPLYCTAAFDPSDLGGDTLVNLFRRVRKEGSQALRLYVDGNLSPRHARQLLELPIRADQTVEDWLAGCLNKGRYGAIINGAEQWSDSLARWVSGLFEPIVDALGPERTFLEIIVFAGNYGFTPFGIHIDDPYSSVVHFHLGPAAKAMTLFTKEEFHTLNGSDDSCFTPAELVPHGRSFAIGPGDIFVQPPHYFHIGNTPEFSIDITVGVSKMSAPKVSKFILNRAIGADWLDAGLDLVSKRAESYAAGHSTLSEWISRSTEEYRLACASNRHLRHPYMIRNKISLRGDSVLRLDPDFPIKVSKRPDEILIFIRGNQVKLAATALTQRLVAAILSEPVTSPSKVRHSLNGEISLEAVCSVLSTLVSLGGFSVDPVPKFGT